MSDDLIERLRLQIAYDEWNVGADEESVARDALARIAELEAENKRLNDSRAEVWQSRIRYHTFLGEVQTFLGSEGNDLWITSRWSISSESAEADDE